MRNTHEIESPPTMICGGMLGLCVCNAVLEEYA